MKGIPGDGPDAAARVYDDVATAVSAITDIERLLEKEDCPLGAWGSNKYRVRCRAIATELQTLADEFAARAGTP